ncbi:TPA: hypothetical protein IHJ56_004355 [Escherichia coli]|nr:hypothetical protein [Escherichia coli]
MDELKSWLNKQVVLCSVLWQGGRYFTSNNVREPLWQAMYEQATVTSSIDGETDD